MNSQSEPLESSGFVAAAQSAIESYRRMIDAVTAQLTDDEFFSRPADQVNSVAIILRHLGGNLKSRWTDFFTTDGEKADRDRDKEFADWDGDRAALMACFEAGWGCFEATVNSLDEDNIRSVVKIRGEPHTVAQALTRSLTHVSYHVGQIALVARMVHDGPWKWLTIAPGASHQHNQTTWGTAASRAVLGADDPSESDSPES